jgi:hypothetical protein
MPARMGLLFLFSLLKALSVLAPPGSRDTFVRIAGGVSRFALRAHCGNWVCQVLAQQIRETWFDQDKDSSYRDGIARDSGGRFWCCW